MTHRKQFDWQLRTRALRLGERTQIMAIVNLTPDSFSGDGLANAALDRKVEAALKALDNGADILDLGAESTRPTATLISPDEEQARLLPALEAILRARAEAVVSIDTYHAATARAALAAGAEIINDVSGLLWDDAMAATVAAHPCGYVLMHTRGLPHEWATLPALRNDEVAPLVLAGLRRQLAVAAQAGIPRQTLVLDPGFGFGKRGAENYALLAHLDQLAEFDLPVLAGLSRKGFLGTTVATVQPAGLAVASERLTATTAANVGCILAGAHILRVHDVQPAREAAAIADAILEGRGRDSRG